MIPDRRGGVNTTRENRIPHSENGRQRRGAGDSAALPQDSLPCASGGATLRHLAGLRSRARGVKHGEVREVVAQIAPVACQQAIGMHFRMRPDQEIGQHS